MSQAQFVEIANPLGFTNETAQLISGLGCTNLKQFKKKDINLDDLQYLTKEDLEVLEVGDTFDYESFEKLKKSLQRKYDKIVKGPCIDDIIKILKSTRKQIEIVNYFMKYVEIKLKENRQDVFIDRNQNKKASEVIIEACDNVLIEVKEFRTLLSSLDRLERYRQDNESFFFTENTKSILAITSGIGVIGASLFIIYKLL
ncbi:uncharacterized protein LOC131674323 [Phymastichus coffea]|uniref:uncharacterized protein LOC131674323 n=1 Tax=Phymastichus coffea TaxID=108790 RepID=UPI00273C46A4|nr:uncharacterized protein LOC131674323 [Phymastichus coffea]